MKKIILLLCALSFSAPAFGLSANALLVNFTMAAGGFGIGGDFEHSKDDYGLGAYFRYYQKDDDPTHPADGYMTIGAFMRPHFYKKNWDLFVTPGFGFITIQRARAGQDDVTTLGPMFTVGVLYQMSDSMAIGAENESFYGWFDEDARGYLLNETSAKLRLNF